LAVKLNTTFGQTNYRFANNILAVILLFGQNLNIIYSETIKNLSVCLIDYFCVSKINDEAEDVNSVLSRFFQIIISLCIFEGTLMRK
jgi:hypothetical protein